MSTPPLISRTIQTPTGPFMVSEADGAIVRATWGYSPDNADTPLLRAAEQQILRYFEGTLTSFDLPLHLPQAPLGHAVCSALLAIPFGETHTYGDLAKTLGKPAQAIGQACGANPIALIIPCHRVLAASGLGGFSGGTGIETKVSLLRHEGAASLLI